jgi:hypothetical protein
VVGWTIPALTFDLSWQDLLKIFLDMKKTWREIHGYDHCFEYGMGKMEENQSS